MGFEGLVYGNGGLEIRGHVYWTRNVRRMSKDEELKTNRLYKGIYAQEEYSKTRESGCRLYSTHKPDLHVTFSVMLRMLSRAS